MLCSRTIGWAGLLSLGVAVAGVLVTGGPAGAHVTVNPGEAEQGGYARVAFRVPNESDSASTTKIELFLPDDAPVASVSTMPVPGWTAQLERKAPAKPVAADEDAQGEQVTEVVSKITWTAAADAAIKPGQFQEFPISLGPLPKVDKMVFKVLQTYSDGKVSRWIEEPAAGGQEPESPAAVLALAAATGGSDHDAAGDPADGAADTVAGGSGAGSGDTDDAGAALAVAIAGLVVALAGAAVGGLALFRTRRSA